jgi:hypothetical protein
MRILCAINPGRDKEDSGLPWLAVQTPSNFLRSTDEARPGHTAGASGLKGEVVRIWTYFYSNLK